MIADKLKEAGWTEISRSLEYKKGDWEIIFDTSSWMEIGSKRNPRIFDVHVPGEYEEEWTVNLIEHLCRIDDERFRLRDALKSIDSTESAKALSLCYHKWLVNVSNEEYFCSVCGQTRPQDFAT